MDEATRLVYERFPHMAWALAHPELGPLLKRAADEGWDPPRFQGELLKTAWFKATQESEREWTRLANEDPATAKARFDSTVQTIIRTAMRLGVPIDSSGEWYGEAGQIARDALNGGWDNGRLEFAIMEKAQYAPDAQTGGALGSATDKVRQTAAQYLVPITDQAAWDIAKLTLTGRLDAGGIEAYFKDQAVARFGGNEQIVRMLNEGLTPRQALAPLQQQTAQLLEIAPDQVDWFDPKYQAMLDYTDDQGQTRPMSLSEGARYVRGLEDWKQTTTAQNQAAELAAFIGKTFGRVA